MGGRKGGRRPKGGDDGQGGSRRGKKKGGHGGGGKDQGPTLKEAQRLEQKAEKNGSRGKGTRREERMAKLRSSWPRRRDQRVDWGKLLDTLKLSFTLELGAHRSHPPREKAHREK